MNTNKRYSPEVRERAVRLVLEQQGEYPSRWAAICSIAGKMVVPPRHYDGGAKRLGVFKNLVIYLAPVSPFPGTHEPIHGA